MHENKCHIFPSSFVDKPATIMCITVVEENINSHFLWWFSLNSLSVKALTQVFCGRGSLVFLGSSTLCTWKKNGQILKTILQRNKL